MIRIALVEDEPSYVDTLREFLARYERERGERLRVSVFSEGDEIALGYRSDYDVILMDIEMRFMDGMTAAEEIRRRDPPGPAPPPAWCPRRGGGPPPCGR